MNTFKIVAREQSALIVNEAAKKSKSIKVPKLGWIKMVRGALSMSGASLARKLGVHRSTLHSLENAESDGSITIKKLKAAADSMGCELIYAIVPIKIQDNTNQTIDNLIINQAKMKAHKIVLKTNEHMALEGQELKNDALIKEVKRKINKGNAK